MDLSRFNKMLLPVVGTRKVQELYRPSNPLWRKIFESELPTADFSGEPGTEVRLPIQLTPGTTGAAIGEYDQFPNGGSPLLDYATVSIVGLYHPRRITARSIRASQGSDQAIVRALATEITDMKAAIQRLKESQLRGSKSGAQAKVTAVTGSGPYTVTFDDDIPFRCQWLVPNPEQNVAFIKLNADGTGTQSGVTGLAASIFRITQVRVGGDWHKVVLEAVSGTYVPVASDNIHIVRYEERNNTSISGLKDLFAKGKPYLGIDPTAPGKENWDASVYEDAGTDAPTLNRISRYANENLDATGFAVNLIACSPGIFQSVLQEANDKQVVYVDDPYFKNQQRVIVNVGDTSVPLYSDRAIRPGEIEAYATEFLGLIGEKDGRFLGTDASQDGTTEILVRLGRSDVFEMTWRQFVGFGTTNRPVHFKVTGLKDDGVLPA